MAERTAKNLIGKLGGGSSIREMSETEVKNKPETTPFDIHLARDYTSG